MTVGAIPGWLLREPPKVSPLIPKRYASDAQQAHIGRLLRQREVPERARRVVMERLATMSVYYASEWITALSRLPKRPVL